MAYFDHTQKLGSANPIGLKEWVVDLTTGLFRDFGQRVDLENIAYISGRIIDELRREPKYNDLSIGFIATGIKGILTGFYDVKKLSAKTILECLMKEGESALPRRVNMNFEITKKDYNRLYANAAQYGDPHQQGAVWAIGLSCSKDTSQGQKFIHRQLSGFWATAALLEGLHPGVLIESNDAEFARLKLQLGPKVAELERRFWDEEARRVNQSNP